MDKEQKSWIDNATYEELLRRWRFAPPGDTIFQGDTGDYYEKIMLRIRKETGNEIHVAASKAIGWDKR